MGKILFLIFSIGTRLIYPATQSKLITAADSILQFETTKFIKKYLIKRKKLL